MDTFWQLLKKIGQLYIPTSGHTGFDITDLYLDSVGVDLVLVYGHDLQGLVVHDDHPGRVLGPII